MDERKATVNAETMPKRMTCDVAAVGYGPAGIVLSALLAQHGLRVIVFEMWPERYRFPRAAHFDGEIMRTAFQKLGIAEQIEMISRALVSFETVTPSGEVLESVVAPYFDGSGWRSDYLFYQPEFEDVIAARGLDLGVSVLMNATVTGIEQQEDSVELKVLPSDDLRGEGSLVQASFVIGADGANSFVRGVIGATKTDLGFQSSNDLVVDFEHHDPDREIPEMGENRFIVDPRRPAVIGRWTSGRMSRLEFRVFEDENRNFIESDEKFGRFLSRSG